MALPGIPHSPEAYFWDRCVELIRANSALTNLVKLLILNEGRTTDIDKWTIDTLPALKVSLDSDGAKWSAEIQHDVSFILDVEFVIESTYPGDFLDFWRAFYTTFFTGDNSVLNNARQYQVFMITMVYPAWKPRTLDDGSRVGYAAGRMKFDMHINT